MSPVGRLIVHHLRQSWRQLCQELPEVMRVVRGKDLQAIFALTISLLLLLVFLLMIGFFRIARIVVGDIPLEVLKGILVGTSLLVFLYALKGTGKVTKHLIFDISDRQLLGTLPITWNQIYLAKLLYRSMQQGAFLWCVAGAIALAATISLGLSWQTGLSWAIALPLFLVFSFALRDFLALIFAHIAQMLAGRLMRLNSVMSIIITLLGFALAAGFSGFIAFIVFRKEKMAIIVEQIISIGQLLYRFVFIFENPFVWLANAFYLAAAGSAVWLFQAFYLLLAASLMVLIAQRYLNCLGLRDRLPFNVHQQGSAIHTSKRRSLMLRYMLDIIKIVPYPVSVLLRKDIIQLARDSAVRRMLTSALLMLSVIVGFIIGFTLSDGWLTTFSRIAVFLPQGKLTEQNTHLFFLSGAFVLSFFCEILASWPILIVTSVDAEGRNIKYLQSLPVDIRYVIYSKMCLHFVLLAAIGTIVSVAAFVLFELPLVYLIALMVLGVSIACVFTAIQVGSTALYPRFQWRHKLEIGGTHKSRLLEMIILPAYWGLSSGLVLGASAYVVWKPYAPISPSMLMFAASAATMVVSCGFAAVMLAVINKKLSVNDGYI